MNIEDLAQGLLSGKRRALAKAITLIENQRPELRSTAEALIRQLLPHTGNALRVGISGVPGVGKSTFVEALGLILVARGHRVAVLAVDPSSQVSGGSIMGDKLRMELLSREPHAFIRPSPTAGTLGGVTRRTRESMLLCEAAGFDILLIETVGVGQSEVTVSEMVDFFMVLLLPGAGDEIQGIKKGIIERADGLIVHKADGDLKQVAARAKRYYRNALHFARPKTRGWQVPVLEASSLTGEGIETVWERVLAHRAFLEEMGLLESLRAEQMRLWFQASLRDGLLDRLFGNQQIQQKIEEFSTEIAAKRRSPHECADEVINLFLAGYSHPANFH